MDTLDADDPLDAAIAASRACDSTADPISSTVIGSRLA
jgi:hypothetical protein